MKHSSLYYSIFRLSSGWAKLLLFSVIVFAIFIGSFSWLANASGSRSLYPNGIGGNRANIEWRTSFYGGAGFLLRRTILKVFAQAGEVILVGSSAVGVGAGDIQIHNPGQITGPVGNEVVPAVPSYSCQTQRGVVPNPALGQITSRAQELAGPDTISDIVNGTPGGVVPGGYVPCFYVAPSTGIYDVIFQGPSGNADTETAPTGQVNLAGAANFNAQQDTSIAVWDVTVRSNVTSAVDINGRLFARYLAFFTGNNNRPVNSTVFILTTDGYIYQTDLRGFDPNGFLLYANDVGFYDADGVTPLYHDAFDGVNNQLTNIQGGVTLAPPTHLVFFEIPSAETIAAIGIPSPPPNPTLNNVDFLGAIRNNDTFISAGGTFTYTSNSAGSYEVLISRDGVNFDPANPLNRVLRGKRPAGTQTITWNGLANDGTPFPVGLNYPVSITIRAGEYHFPMLDIENSTNGGPQFTLLNPPGGVCPSYYGSTPSCTTAFYDDRGYTTVSGTVGTPGVVLPGGINPPTTPNSDLLRGFDSSTNQRAFGGVGNNGFGDKKGLDLWVYFPSQPLGTFINIFGLNLVLDKGVSSGTLSPGATLTYTLSFTNTGPITATGVVITEVVPANTTFNPAASSPGWTFTGVTSGSVVTRVVGTVPGNSVANPPVTFVVTLDNPLAAGVTQIANSAVIGDDGSNGPEPTNDNIDAANTPVNNPVPPPPPSGGNGGGGGGAGADDDDDNDPLPPPPVGQSSAPSPVQPTPELPVLFLPETGFKETGFNFEAFGEMVAFIASAAIGSAAYLTRRKLRK